MATGTLEGTTIAATYKSLLKVKGGANTVLHATTHQLVEDGDGNDSVLSLAIDSVGITGSGSRLYFSDKGGEYISGNGSILSIVGGAEIDLTATAIDINGTCDVSGTLNVGGNVGIGETSADTRLHVVTAYDAVNATLKVQSNDNDGCGISFWNQDSGPHANSRRWQMTTNGSDYGDFELFRSTSNSGNPATNVIRITKDSDVLFQGDLIMADGKGIDFSAKTPDESGAGSMSNEILDDYEEGTWTPVLTDGSNDASMHGNTAGTYTKIGRQVTIWAYVQTSNLGSVSGAISIKGLPFSQASTDAHGAGTWGYGNSMAISAGTNITGMVGSSTAIMNIRHWDVAGGTSALQGSQWSSDADCSFTCSYIT